MEALYFVALFSFILGGLGYIVVRFWFMPIFRYKKLKRRIAKSLMVIADRIDNEKNKTNAIPKNTETNRSLKQHAVFLSECYQNELPHWYRLLLYHRREDPVEASKHIMGLVNIRNRSDIAKRLETIRASIRIKR
jgi:hypothetical protein